MTTKIVREFRPEKVPKPDLCSLDGFASSRPLDLEIGCGVGLHPIRHAQKFPERDIVAIEHTHIRFQKFQRRLENHPEIKNVLPIHGNAISWVTHYAPCEIFDQVYLLYPNPRDFWYCHPFMHRLLQSMKPSGVLELRTNLKDYAEEAAGYFEEVFHLVKVLEQTLLKCSSVVAVTHFEKKYLERGESCFLQKWRKPETFR